MAKNPVSVNAGNLDMINKKLAEQADLYNKLGAKEEAMFLKQKMAENSRTAINKLLKEQLELTNLIGPKTIEQEETLAKIPDLLNTISKEHAKLISSLKAENELLKSGTKWRQLGVDLTRELGNQLKLGWTYLQLSDKAIKSTILNLGMSGAKAVEMRLSFEQSAQFAATLGANLEDIQKIQEGFADETGRARALSAQMVEDVVSMGKGTGLGIENATKLGAQFEYMGVDIKNTMSFVQGVVDTSERMGDNTTKVLKTVHDNFKRLSTFTFQGGVKAMGQMSMNAEKTRVSLSTALNVAEATRGLDKVIELGANLQVMGGEFAKMDPFQWLYMARNEPDKMTEKISEMTKGIYTLRKNSDGTFEKFISPEDRDRLANVAKSLGISQEEMSQIAQRRLDLSILDKQTAGMGLTKREKELIQGASIMNSATGRYQVLLGGHMQDISTLTKDQAESFAKEQVLLKDRAKEALTFDEAFKNTINALKAALLPLLDNVNGLLKTVRPIFDTISKFGTTGAITTLLLAGLAWKGVIGVLGKLTSIFVEKGISTVGGSIGRIFSKKPEYGPQLLKKPAGGGTFGGGAGGTALGIGAGIGAAALGTGAGIGLAAGGISKLAEAMAKLDATQIAALPWTILALGGAIAAFTIPLAFLGPTLDVATPGLYAFGVAALGIGAGIGAAGWGIGQMAEGLAKLVDVSKGADWGLAKVGASLYVIAGGVAALGAGGIASMFGVVGLVTTLGSIAAFAPAINTVGESFKNISTALSGNKEDFIAVQQAVEAISRVNTSGGGMLADLANLLRSPLKVEFADKNVAVVSNITMEIDGEKLFQKIYRPVAAIESTNNARIFGIHKQ